MKDSAKLLSFKTDRRLGFQAFRKLEMAVQRQLSFTVGRQLKFMSCRELGFGRRGVVFRGYVCPVCKSPVAKDDPKCEDCGTVFQQPKPQAKPPRPEPKQRISRQAPAQSQAAQVKKAQQPPQAPPRATFQCPVCSAFLYVGTAQCPACRTSFTQAPQSSQARIPQPVPCPKCSFPIPHTDMFCRRCGSPKDIQNQQSHDDGIVSWDNYETKEAKA